MALYTIQLGASPGGCAIAKASIGSASCGIETRHSEAV